MQKHDNECQDMKCYKAEWLCYLPTGSGTVSVSEFVGNWMQNTGMSQEASLFIFFLMDADEDMGIDSAEHTAIFHKMDDNSEWMTATNMPIDSFISLWFQLSISCFTEDGSVAFSEFSHHMSLIGQALVHLTTAKSALSARFASVDSNNDGSLSRAEAVAMFGAADTNGQLSSNMTTCL